MSVFICIYVWLPTEKAQILARRHNSYIRNYFYLLPVFCLCMNTSGKKTRELID